MTGVGHVYITPACHNDQLTRGLHKPAHMVIVRPTMTHPCLMTPVLLGPDLGRFPLIVEGKVPRKTRYIHTL